MQVYCTYYDDNDIVLQETLVTYASLTRIRWRPVNVQDYNNIMRKVNCMRTYGILNAVGRVLF